MSNSTTIPDSGFHGRRVVVTSAGSGIGRATALEFAEEGAHVLVTDRDRDAVRQVVKTIEYGGGTALAIVGDLGDQRVAEQIVATALEAFGGIDVLVNNAGVMDALTRAALPHMLADGGGSVVFTTSETRTTPEAPTGSEAPTVSEQGIVSEHEIVGTVRDLADMYRDRGIRANAITTGPTVTGTGPEEQAAAIVFLASDAAHDINGTVLPADRGRPTV